VGLSDSMRSSKGEHREKNVLAHRAEKVVPVFRAQPCVRHE
jgi:hypothetical protein